MGKNVFILMKYLPSQDLSSEKLSFTHVQMLLCGQLDL